jgi:hypothetical protein
VRNNLISILLILSSFIILGGCTEKEKERDKDGTHYNESMESIRTFISGKGSTPERFTALNQEENNLRERRTKDGLQSYADEFTYNSFVGALELIPRPPEFDKSKCSEYESNIRSQFLSEDNNQQNAGMEGALNILSELCR